MDSELHELYQSNLKEDNYKDAAEYMTLLIQRHPNLDSLYYKRTLAFYNFKTQVGDSLILMDLNKCIELNPSNDNYRYLRALLFARNKDYLSAIKDYEIIVNNHPDLFVFLAEKAKIHFMAKQFEKAINDYEKILTNELPYYIALDSYYYLIFSRYFANDITGAIFACAALPEMGFEEDTILMRMIANDSVAFSDVAILDFLAVDPEELGKVFDK